MTEEEKNEKKERKKKKKKIVGSNMAEHGRSICEQCIEPSHGVHRCLVSGTVHGHFTRNLCCIFSVSKFLSHRMRSPSSPMWAFLSIWMKNMTSLLEPHFQITTPYKTAEKVDNIKVKPAAEMKSHATEQKVCKGSLNTTSQSCWRVRTSCWEAKEELGQLV